MSVLELAPGRLGSCVTEVGVAGARVNHATYSAPYEEAARVRRSAQLATEIESCLGDYVRYVLERDVRSAGFVETLRRHPAVRQTNTPA